MSAISQLLRHTNPVPVGLKFAVVLSTIIAAANALFLGSLYHEMRIFWLAEYQELYWPVALFLFFWLGALLLVTRGLQLNRHEWAVHAYVAACCLYSLPILTGLFGVVLLLGLSGLSLFFLVPFVLRMLWTALREVFK